MCGAGEGYEGREETVNVKSGMRARKVSSFSFSSPIFQFLGISGALISAPGIPLFPPSFHYFVLFFPGKLFSDRRQINGAASFLHSAERRGKRDGR